MSAIHIALAVLLGSLGWACVSFVRQERRSQQEWQAAPAPRTEVGDPPYRVVTVTAHPLTRAPWLVRVAALGCLWIGQGIFPLMLVATFFLRRRSNILFGSNPDSGSTGWAGIVSSLGPMLLRRDRGAAAIATVAATLLRYWAGALVIFPLIFLGAGKAPVFWSSLLFFGVMCGVLAGVLTLVERRYEALFPSGETPDAAVSA